MDRKINAWRARTPARLCVGQSVFPTQPVLPKTPNPTSALHKTLSPRDLTFCEIQRRAVRYIYRSFALSVGLSCVGALFVLLPIVLSLLNAAKAMVSELPSTTNTSETEGQYVVRYFKTDAACDDGGGCFVAPRIEEVPKFTQVSD